MEADRKADKEEIEADRKAWRGEMAAMRDRWMNDNHNEAMACQEMEARQEEEGPTSMEMKPEATEEEEESPQQTPKYCRSENRRRNGVGTDNWPRNAAARNRRIQHGKIVDPQRNWPTRRCPVVQQWHDARETSACRTRPAVRKWHSTGDTSSGTIRLGTTLQEVPTEGRDFR
jgi:hypothetical protein